MHTMINEGRVAGLLMSVFNLATPVAFNDVKRRWRQLSRVHHPDVEGGDEETFKKLSDVWDQVRALHERGSRLFSAPEHTEFGEDGMPTAVFPTETLDGTPLSKLGLGLGPTKNGRECGSCEGVGYQVTTEHFRKHCDDCSGSGYVPGEFSCRPCNGTGKFTQRRSGRVVDCLACQGSGVFKHPTRQMYCRKCRGSGRLPSKVAHYYVHTCTSCKGTGEIELDNPVLPRGRIMNQSHMDGAARKPEGHGERQRQRKSKRAKDSSAKTTPAQSTPSAESLAALAERFNQR